MNDRPKRNTPAGEASQRATSGQNVPKPGERANAGTRRRNGAGSLFGENGKRNSMPAIPTLTPAGASTTSISSSRRDGITTSFKAALNRLAAAPAGTAPGLWIR